MHNKTLFNPRNLKKAFQVFICGHETLWQNNFNVAEPLDRMAKKEVVKRRECLHEFSGWRYRTRHVKCKKKYKKEEKKQQACFIDAIPAFLFMYYFL